jgi:peroxiredoxin
MRAAYAHLDVYADHGREEVVFHGPASDFVDREEFDTAFLRGRRFRFAVNVQHHEDSPLVVWSDFAHTYTLFAGNSDASIVDDGKDLPLALGSLAHVAGVTIPGLLLPATLGSAVATTLRDAVVVGGEWRAGHYLWRVTGHDLRDDPVALWIDRDTHMLLRLEVSHRFDGYSTETALEFTPEPNPTGIAKRTQPLDLITHPASPRRLRNLPSTPYTGIFFSGQGTQVLFAGPASPAFVAGLARHDEILAVDGTLTTRLNDLVQLLNRHLPGETVMLTVRRAGASNDIPLALEHFRDELDAPVDQLVRKSAPAFDLPVVTGGGSANLKELSGSVVVLNLWSVACQRCAAVTTHLDALARAHPSLRVVGISSDPANDIARYGTAHHLRYTLARDDDGHVASLYWRDWRVAWPMLVVIDRSGVVRDVEIGLDNQAAFDASVAAMNP